MQSEEGVSTVNAMVEVASLRREQDLKGRGSHKACLEKDTPGRGSSLCKGPGVGTSFDAARDQRGGQHD